MIEIKGILFPTDFSRCAEQALLHALYLSKQYQAQLHILHAIVLQGYTTNYSDYDFADLKAVHKQMEYIAMKQMSSLLESHHSDLVRIQQVRKRGIAAAPVIVDYAKDQDIDLIVMGTHGRRGLGHLFLGSVAEEVVRFAPCPVLTIKERQELKPIEELDRILVPVDFSKYSRLALRYAKQIATSYDSHLQLLHVVERPIQPAFYLAEHFYDVTERIRSRSKGELEKLFQETEGPELSAEFHVFEGRASVEIAEFAKSHGSDLIVIATHGLTGLEHLVIGSTTEKVVRRAACPVFTVKAFGKSLFP